ATAAGMPNRMRPAVSAAATAPTTPFVCRAPVVRARVIASPSSEVRAAPPLAEGTYAKHRFEAIRRQAESRQSPALLHSYRFGQITRLIHVRAHHDGRVIGDQLYGYGIKQRIRERVRPRHLQMRVQIAARF